MDDRLPKWMAHIVAGLAVAAVTSTIVFDVRISREIARALQAIENIEKDMAKLERRLERIEKIAP